MVLCDDRISWTLGLHPSHSLAFLIVRATDLRIIVFAASTGKARFLTRVSTRQRALVKSALAHLAREWNIERKHVGRWV